MIEPCLKFASHKPIDQFAHIRTEVIEAWQELINGNWERTAEELVDIQTSCETLLYIIQAKHDVNIASIKRQVIEKNRQRGYLE
jgi:hypothetical protein